MVCDYTIPSQQQWICPGTGAISCQKINAVEIWLTPFGTNQQVKIYGGDDTTPLYSPSPGSSSALTIPKEPGEERRRERERERERSWRLQHFLRRHLRKLRQSPDLCFCSLPIGSESKPSASPICRRDRESLCVTEATKDTGHPPSFRPRHQWSRNNQPRFASDFNLAGLLVFVGLEAKRCDLQDLGSEIGYF